MTTTPTETMKTLAALIAAEPALEAALRNTASAQQYAEIAAASARRHGLTLDEADLQAHLRAQSGQAAQEHAGADMTDQQLAAVAGGGPALNRFNSLFPYRPTTSDR